MSFLKLSQANPSVSDFYPVFCHGNRNSACTRDISSTCHLSRPPPDSQLVLLCPSHIHTLTVEPCADDYFLEAFPGPLSLRDPAMTFYQTAQFYHLALITLYSLVLLFSSFCKHKGTWQSCAMLPPGTDSLHTHTPLTRSVSLNRGLGLPSTYFLLCLL